LDLDHIRPLPSPTIQFADGSQDTLDHLYRISSTTKFGSFHIDPAQSLDQNSGTAPVTRTSPLNETSPNRLDRLYGCSPESTVGDDNPENRLHRTQCRQAPVPSLNRPSGLFHFFKGQTWSG
jgi:hypothetical protein